MEKFGGPLAALTTALLWSFTSLFFAAAGRRIGSFTVNQIRLIIALLLLTGAHLVLFGSLWPGYATGNQIGLLALSGLIGLVLGDSLLFRAFVVLGVKGSLLMMTLWPAMAFLLAWPILGEQPTLFVFIGMVVTLSGVALSIWARRGDSSVHEPKPTLEGIVLGVGGAFGQALGIVIAKPALIEMKEIEALSALSGTQIRMAAAALVLWSWAVVRILMLRARGRPNPLTEALRDRTAILQTAGGSVCGPFLGVTLSLLALQLTTIGVATTIMSIVPIMVMPWMYLIYRERPRALEIGGALIAMAGVAILFLEITA